MLSLVTIVLAWFLAATLLASPWAVGLGQALVRGLSAEDQNAVSAFFLQTVFYAVALAALALIVLGRRHARIADLGWRRCGWRWIPIAIVAAIASYYLVTLLGGWIESLFPHAENPQVAQTQHDFGHVYVLAILSDVVIPPIAEETFFRGFVYGWLRRHLPVAPAAIIGGAFFALLHPLIVFVPILVLGVILALLYEYSRSLIPGALVHGLFNLVNLLQILGG